MTEFFSHVILFFFISTENSDFCNIAFEESMKNCSSKGSCPSGNQKNLSLKHAKALKNN